MNELHTIRFKSGDVEFELTGSQTDVRMAWQALQPAVVAAFVGPDGASRRRSPGTSEDVPKPAVVSDPRRAKRAGRRTAGSGKSASDGREEIVRTLLDADFDTFSELPSDAKAVYRGLATLKWARDQLGIDGLAISDIHRFLSEKLRYGQTAEAYRFAFKQLPRAANATGSPKIYRLMRPGEEALDALLRTVAAGGSEKEAETAGAEAERKA